MVETQTRESERQYETETKAAVSKQLIGRERGRESEKNRERETNAEGQREVNEKRQTDIN